MANFDIPTPANLDNLDAEQPLGTEDRSKLDDALRQTRALLKDVFLKEHNADGTHKNIVGPVFSDDSPGLITGDMIAEDSIDTDHIKDKAVTTEKIDDDAVTGDQLADNSVASNHIVNGTIIGEDIANLAVDVSKLADLSVSTGKLQTDAVSTQKIQDDAVNGDKIADGVILPSHMGAAGEHKILVGNSTGGMDAVRVGGDASMVLDSGVAKFQLSLTAGASPYATLTVDNNPTLVQTLTRDAWLELPRRAAGWTTYNGPSAIFGAGTVGNNIILQAGTYVVDIAYVFGLADKQQLSHTYPPYFPVVLGSSMPLLNYLEDYGVAHNVQAIFLRLVRAGAPSEDLIRGGPFFPNSTSHLHGFFTMPVADRLILQAYHPTSVYTTSIREGLNRWSSLTNRTPYDGDSGRMTFLRLA